MPSVDELFATFPDAAEMIPVMKRAGWSLREGSIPKA